MIPRRQLPVHSPIRFRNLVRAGLSAVGAPAESSTLLEGLLAREFTCAAVALTDSGTSALVLALRMACTRHRVVALPAFSCIDLTAAVLHAGVDVVLYDLDPATLTPDEASLGEALAAGVDAVVIAHLYGYPADMISIARMASAHGVTVIEDAAQSAGAAVHGRPAGGHGALTVLSFGRGKGVTGGGGGALLASDPRFVDAVEAWRERAGPASSGVRTLVAAGAQWMLGRPSLYALPSFVPGLHLGEMVYHPAHEPRRMPRAAVALATAALDDAVVEQRARAVHAALLTSVASRSGDIDPITPLPGASPGFLRLPVLDRGSRSPDPRLGVLRSYPRALHEQAELQPRLRRRSGALPGALQLRESLFTLPTHSRLTSADIADISRWLAPRDASRAVPRDASVHSAA